MSVILYLVAIIDGYQTHHFRLQKFVTVGLKYIIALGATPFYQFTTGLIQAEAWQLKPR